MQRVTVYTVDQVVAVWSQLDDQFTLKLFVILNVVGFSFVYYLVLLIFQTEDGKKKEIARKSRNFVRKIT